MNAEFLLIDVQLAGADEQRVVDVLARFDAEPLEWSERRLAALLRQPHLEACRAQLRACGVTDESLCIEPAETADDGSIITALLEPEQVAGLWIVPRGHPSFSPAPRLELDTHGAFGTGLHPTTRLCLEAMAHWAPTDPLLDVGTGSGVLALTWLVRGGPSAVATDIDPRARRAIRANARRNGLEDRLTVNDGSLPPLLCAPQFKRIVANIVAAPLVDLAPHLVRQLGPGGRLLLSGLQGSDQTAAVTSAYRACGLRPAGEFEHQGWQALEFMTAW